MSDEPKTEELEDEQIEQVEEPTVDELEALILGEEVEEEAAEEEVAEVSEDEIIKEEEADKPEAEEVAEEAKPEKDDAPESTEEAEKPETDKTTDNKAWAKQRHEIKKLKEQLAKKEAPEPITAIVDTAKAAVDKLVKVWNDGTGDDKPMLNAVRNANSKELADIYQQAVANKFGEHSDDVITMIQREMPMVQQRESQQQNVAKSNREAILKEFNDEADMAKSDFPAFAEKDSDGAKFLNEFTEKLAGKLDDSGKHDGKGDLPEDLALYLHSHPYVAQQLADRVFNAQSLKSTASKAEVAKLTKERDTYKKRLGKYESVAKPSASRSSSEPVGSSLKELEAQILG